MEQGNDSRAAVVARTAGMTDEEIMELDLDQIAAAGADGARRSVRHAVTNGADARGGRGISASAESATYGRVSAPENPEMPGPVPAVSGTGAQDAQDEPAWLKRLEAQPEAAAEARQWREAAHDVAALDAAYFSGDPSTRSGLAVQLYESDPAAFREMLAESARILASRDPQAVAELARQLGIADTQAQNAPGRSVAQAARASQYGAATQVPSADLRAETGFPAEAYRAFEAATNDDVARSTREAIQRTLSSALPDGVSEGARRRIGDDIFNELHATLAADRDLTQQVGEILRGWRFDAGTRQQLVALISSRARSVVPAVSRRVISEWTSSVLASDRARAARVQAASSRREVTGGRLPEPVPGRALCPKDIDYSRMSDEQILNL